MAVMAGSERRLRNPVYALVGKESGEPAKADLVEGRAFLVFTTELAAHEFMWGHGLDHNLYVTAGATTVGHVEWMAERFGGDCPLLVIDMPGDRAAEIRHHPFSRLVEIARENAG